MKPDKEYDSLFEDVSEVIRGYRERFMPTMYLRLVKRGRVKVLQQCWRDAVGNTDWRDVPVVDRKARTKR
jgi:hypothetical protein